MKKSIAVISPRSVDIKKNFQLDNITKKYNIIYLDCSPIFGNKIKKKKNTILIKSYYQLYKFLDKNNNIYVLDLLSFNFKLSTNILRLIIRSKSKPILYVHGLRFRPKTNLKNNSLFEYFNKISNFIFKFLFKNIVFKKHHIFISGTYREKMHEKLSNLNINYIVSKDYVKLKNVRIHLKPYNSYVVFIDEDVPNHIDYKLSNIKSPISEKKYYKKLKFFFKKIESIYNTKIVIALHPKSKIKKIKEFQSFKIFKGKTEALIKNSSFVMFHASTAISYAVILKKPILSLTCNEFYKSYFIEEINQISKLLSSKIINIDLLNNFKSTKLNISKMSYNNYINNFIKHPKSKNKSIEDYLIKWIS